MTCVLVCRTYEGPPLPRWSTVRQCENEIRRWLARPTAAQGEWATILDAGTGAFLRRYVRRRDAVERVDEEGEADVVRAALAAATGNVRAAARALGVSERTLTRRITALGLREWLRDKYPLEDVQAARRERERAG
jgi:DNA-binding NtrC family response regulator